MRFVLLGASGYVGTEIATRLIERGHTVIPVNRRDVNLYDDQALSRFLESHTPDALINAAGHTGKPNVDACETDKVNCLAGNAVLPGVVANAVTRLGIPWGHVSSGCIYTGRRADGTGFTEADTPNFCFRTNNCSFYSGTKALGEEILAGNPNSYLWRLRIPFSNLDSARNYISKLLRYETLLEAENSLSYLPEFVDAAIDSFEKRLPFGIYNLTNPGSITTRHVVDLIQTTLRPAKRFHFFADEAQFMQTAAKTPRSNCVLDSSKAINAGLQLTPISQALTQALETWTQASTRS